jgi:putative transposase
MTLLDGWVHQAYRYEVGRPTNPQVIPSHQGAKRFAWNWGLPLVEEQLRAREVFRALAIRQGASTDEAQVFAGQAASIPYLVQMNEDRRKDHERLVTEGKREQGEFHPVPEWCPWSKEALRYIWNREKDEAAPWWAENSKECYSSAFEALAQAFKNHFGSRDGKRAAPRLGWPKYKSRASRQSVGFTTGRV